jgi:hypothetical protein
MKREIKVNDVRPKNQFLDELRAETSRFDSLISGLIDSAPSVRIDNDAIRALVSGHKRYLSVILTRATRREKDGK